MHYRTHLTWAPPPLVLWSDGLWRPIPEALLVCRSFPASSPVRSIPRVIIKIQIEIKPLLTEG